MCANTEGKSVVVIIKDVPYISILRENLISVKRSTYKGFKVIFGDQECFITNVVTVFITKVYNNLYKLKDTREVLTASLMEME